MSEEKIRDKIPEESTGNMVMEPEEEIINNKDTLSEVVVMLPEVEEGKEMEEGMSTNRLEKRLE